MGAAIRRWRNRLSPSDAGLPQVGKRRVSGLRREELAALAGISVDYLMRLEQGRATRPSDQIVDALTRALQLDEAERDHLYQLAHLPSPSSGQISTHIPPSVQRLIAGLREQPVAVFAADWTLITWTPLWASLVGDPALIPRSRRNFVLETFLPDPEHKRWRVRSERGQEAIEAALVADLRTAQGNFSDDPTLDQMISECRARSRRFAQLWAEGAAGHHLHDRKTVSHPLVGDITLDCDVLTIPGSDLKIVIYTTAAATKAAEQLDFLRVSAVNVSFDGAWHCNGEKH
ncbi:transcriptional regulator [Streptomyces violaceusniger]|uniref:Transcriptional regulator n=1 Tax=Streptomyces violaceusniger TaxID=68280 RepID=A0A4D4KVB1_STRVO|nr:transcriptional regulator [Streptomyces violaceusniger]